MEKQAFQIKVSLADDHILLRSALASLIDSFGDCRVINQSNNGKELIDWFENGLVADVAILDLNMPEMNGYDVCRSIRRTQRGKGIRIVALTGWGQEQDRRNTREAGFDAHLVKPVDVKVLGDVLAGGKA